jgi:hypothetical protein
MEAALFARMLSDKNFTNLRRMRHKYSEDAVVEMVSILRESFFKRLPISDFDGEPLAYLEGPLRLRSSASKLLLRARQQNPR